MGCNYTHKFISKALFILAFSLLLLSQETLSQSKEDIIIKATQFYRKDDPFVYNGISFFNALYNPNFNRNDSTRNYWLKKFHDYGVNVIRVWG